MADYEVEHDREGCISCGACAAAAPNLWEMADDGKSKLKGGKNKLEIDQKDFDHMMEAAQACPVNVIHIKNLKDGKKLI